ncbi:unnamed protein product [Lactuca virosa]|uniref:Uncharacterized protein n=1 Tax=Lactuca virosa TaxID=75947 RepID=A0AAU9NL22_9ASTR|nr:unnamed protein product [Lactuca virosa]
MFEFRTLKNRGGVVEDLGFILFLKVQNHTHVSLSLSHTPSLPLESSLLRQRSTEAAINVKFSSDSRSMKMK